MFLIYISHLYISVSLSDSISLSRIACLLSLISLPCAAQNKAHLVIVTGARPQISVLMRQAGIREEFRDDVRVTTKEALQVYWKLC